MDSEPETDWIALVSVIDPVEVPVMVAVSFTFVTVIATALVVVAVPSETATVILYTLSPLESVGDSKLGEALKVTTPVEEFILNNAESEPPEME